jgi:tetratricopeptide (TPR) repeat protein
MRKLHTASILVLSLGVFLGLAAPLQAQTGGLEGEAKDLEGKPMADVTVEIKRTDIKMQFEAKTDSKGYYVYMGLPAAGARYTVTLIRNGERIYSFRDVPLEVGSIKRLDFDLKKEREIQQTLLTEEQKKQMEERRKAIAKGQVLRANFDLGLQLLREPNAELVCSSRCPEDSPDQASCLSECQAQAGQGLKQMAYQEAITAFNRAAEADPEQYAVWANLGRAYSLTNQINEGIESYQKAIALKPEEAATYNNLGQLYVKSGQVEKAQEAFSIAAEKNPAEAGAYYYNLGVTFYNAGNLQAAVQPLRKATEVAPDRADAFYWLGVCLFGSAETQIEGGSVKTVLQPGTREAFEQYLALEPDGRFANDAKAMLEAIQQTAPAAVRVDKKKK